MARSPAPEPTPQSSLRDYPLRSRGKLILACGKCQRRLKADGDVEGIASLKKLIKRLAKRGASPAPPLLLKVGCLKLCPGDGITVASEDQLSRHVCSIVRTQDDVKSFYAQCEAAVPVSRRVTSDRRR